RRNVVTWTAPPARAASSTVANVTRRRIDIRLGLRRPQRVADAPQRMNQRRLIAVDLLAQVADVRLDDPSVASEVVLPDVIEDLRLREHLARVQQQIAQQRELGRAEIDATLAAANLSRLLVEFEIEERKPVRNGGRSRRPAQDRVH